jgi:hypothetical protein
LLGHRLGAQDATLRSGISQVVSMNKRGTAFGAFNAAYGVLWFLGSVTMGRALRLLAVGAGGIWNDSAGGGGRDVLLVAQASGRLKEA